MSPLRRAARLILPASAGLVAAFVGWLYAEQPAWTSDEFGPCTHLGFGGDGRTLMSVHPTQSATGELHAVVVRRDANGRILGKSPMAGRGATQIVTASVDADTVALAVACDGSPSHRIELYDAASNRTVTAPLDGVPGAIILARRWLAVWCADGFDVRSIADGSLVVRLGRRADAAVVSADFSPDGRRMALLCYPFDKSRSDWIELVDMPSGRLLRRFDVALGPGRWSGIHWPDANRVFANTGSSWLSFGIDGDDFGVPWPEPHLNDSSKRTTFAIAPAWFARTEQGEVEPWQAWGNHWLGRLGLAPLWQRPIANRVRVIDRQTRRTRAVWPIIGNAPALADDGRRFASVDPDGRVVVYCENAFFPAVWATTFGLTVALFIGVVTYRRRAITVRP